MSIVYIIVLLFLGLVLIGLEMFVPGGIIGIIGATMMGIGVWLCFDQYGMQEGFAVLLLCIAATIVVVVTAFRKFPHTTVGKWVILGSNASKEEGYTSDTYFNAGLLNKEGITESKLRPSGIALFDGDRYDVVTEGEYVDANTRVRVLRVDGNRIVVEKVY